MAPHHHENLCHPGLLHGDQAPQAHPEGLGHGHWEKLLQRGDTVASQAAAGMGGSMRFVATAWLPPFQRAVSTLGLRVRVAAELKPSPAKIGD